MSFIQTGFLLACAAVAIPLVVHLLNRWQVRRVELGTMRFLDEVIRGGAQRRRIRKWLLLATRMALVALLALLFARPYLLQSTRGGGDRLRIVLVDRSASMGMPGKQGRLVDDAVQAATASLGDIDDETKVLWAWFDGQVQPLREASTRPSPPRVLDGHTDYVSALAWARDTVAAHPDSLAEVLIVTDLQRSGLASRQTSSVLPDSSQTGAEGLGFPGDVPVQLVDVGRAAANNLAITQLNIGTTRIDAHRPLKFSTTLFNFGSLPYEDVPLIVSAFDGKRTVRLTKSVSVPGGQAEDISIDLGNLQPGVWQITVSLDVEDDLAADNRRLTAMEVARPIDILVLDAGSHTAGSQSESFYLAAALNQGQRAFDDSLASLTSGESSATTLVTTTDDGNVPASSRRRFAAEVLYLQDHPLPRLAAERHPLVVVSNAAQLSERIVGELQNYTRQGGRLLVFAGEGSSARSLEPWNESPLAPGTLGAPRGSGVTPFRIATIQTGTSMLSPFEDPQHGDLSRLAFHKRLPVTVAQTTKVLAAFAPDAPAVTEHSLGHGRVAWFMSSADASWGNWTTSPLYLPMVQQMAADLLNLTGEGPIRFRHVGDMQSEHAGFEPRDEALYVVNSSAQEFDPTRIEAAEFAEHFGLSLVDSFAATSIRQVAKQKPYEVWPWLAAIVFVLLVAEFALANRTSA
ncbi:BatA domain-containing protein [Roseimaritima ulvae]|uniref:Aerotolerance regulator N-terminal domain-containing protein n=1 Tax=Roseimaritima ulvae TaxID=980254 RepID=A0A5B9R9E0_9BACT|nr:BatA domain-containing protein [Roseimaritima ulvae]QEG43601.1 hypothetical protein UC8_56520 [Roseimaritima ulvae]